MQSRYYDSLVGRFISCSNDVSSLDNVISENLYQYSNQLTAISTGKIISKGYFHEQQNIGNTLHQSSENYKQIGYLAFKEYDSNYSGSAFTNTFLGSAFSLVPAMTALGKTAFGSGTVINCMLWGFNSVVAGVLIFAEVLMADQY